MRLRTLTSSALAAVAVMSGLAIFAPAAAAATEDFSFTTMTSDFYLGRDAGGNATLRTVETFVAEFPEFDQNHGIERAIPLKYGEADLHLSVKSVTDETGTSVPYTRNDSDGFAVLRLGSASTYVHGTTTYRVEYTQRNVVRSFDDTTSDEFYWDVNGTGWSQPFGSVTATVHFEGGISSALTGNLACYQGYAGSTNRCEINSADGTVVAIATDLKASQNMTIAIGFEPDTFVDPPLLKNSWFFALLPWLLIGLSGLTCAVALILRFVVWRDARGRGIIIPQYSPREDTYPMLAAELLGRQSTSLPAQIVRFAVAKVLAIRETPDRPKNQRYELELLPGWTEVPESEQAVLSDLFGSLSTGTKLSLTSTDRALGDRIARRRQRTASEMVKRGWRARPESSLPRFLARGAFSLGIAAIIIFIAAGINAVQQPVIVWAALACSLGWLFVLGLVSPPLVMTEAGAEVRDYLFGIRDYIALAEADRFRFHQAPETAERIDVTDESALIKLYEELLPYAIIFGLERKWVEELGRHYSVNEQPGWYAGGNDLSRIVGFSSAVAATRFATTPSASSSTSSWSSSGSSSSSSGGSSGGGSSGGGGGGGGGGGW